MTDHHLTECQCQACWDRENGSYLRGYQEGIHSERDRIVNFFKAYGVPEPVTDFMMVPCKHGQHLWESCDQCAMEQILTFITGREHEGDEQ